MGISYDIRLQYPDESHNCGGILLTNYLILTAAHCLYNISYSSVEILARPSSDNYKYDENYTAAIREAIIHDDFDPESYKNNIAILVLKKSLRFNQSDIEIPRIPTENVEFADSAEVNNWGDVQSWGAMSGLNLSVTLFNGTICKGKLVEHYLKPLVNTGMLCAELNKDGWHGQPCELNPGGPVTCFIKGRPDKAFVCGIIYDVERGVGCRGQEGKLGLYVNVSSYYDWIMEKTCFYRWEHQCPSGYYRCYNNMCVTRDSLCDDVNDCGDSSDEMYCTKDTPLPRRSLTAKVQSLGHEALNVDVPFQVELLHRNGSHLCGGTIFATNLILTAAHCFDKIHYRDVQVRAAKFSRFKCGENEQTLDILAAIIHEHYDPKSYKNDIALLLLNGKLSFGSNVASALMSNGKVELTDTAMVSGWAYETGPASKTADNMRQSMLTVLNKTACKENWGENYFDSANDTGRLCMLRDEAVGAQYACQHDPGGPLVCASKENHMKRIVCGIVSGGQRVVQCGVEATGPGLYVKLSSYYDWIMKESCFYRYKQECPPRHLRCQNQVCVDLNSACDRFDDCNDGSDENCDDGWFRVNWFNRQRQHHYIKIGSEASPGEIPYQVQLQYQNGSHLCGGTILSSRLVLTAAHCIDGRSCGDIHVVAGQHSLRENDGTEQTVDIQHTIIHEEYDPELYENDIAILVLEKSLEFGEYVSSIMLPTKQTKLSASAIVSGWGHVPELDLKNAETLRQTTVTILNFTACNQKWGDAHFDPEYDTGKLCASEQGADGFHDACSGDSGGPLVCKNERRSQQIVCGIVSSGESCGNNSSWPGLYTKVSSFYEWIMNRTCVHREQHDCPSGYFRCCNNLCVSGESVCDKFDDCGDGSDEKYCTKGICPSIGRCPSYDLQVCPKMFHSLEDAAVSESTPSFSDIPRKIWTSGPLSFILVFVMVAVLITCLVHVMYASYYGYQKINIPLGEPTHERTVPEDAGSVI